MTYRSEKMEKLMKELFASIRADAERMSTESRRKRIRHLAEAKALEKLVAMYPTEYNNLFSAELIALELAEEESLEE